MTRTATEIEGRIASAGGIIIPIAATSPRSSPMCEDDESRTPQEQRAGTRRARKYCSRSSTVLQPPPSSRTTRNGSCTGRAALVQLLLVLAQLLVAFAPVASSSSYPRGSPSWASLRSPWRSPHRWGSFAGQLVGRRQEPVSAAVVSTMVPRGGLLIQDDDESDDDEEEGEEYDEYETGDEGDEYDEEEEEEDAVVATAGSEKKAAKAKKQKGSAVLADAEYDEPLVASPLTNMYASIAVILLGRKVDLMSPTVVRIARCVRLCCAALCLLAPAMRLRCDFKPCFGRFSKAHIILSKTHHHTRAIADSPSSRTWWRSRSSSCTFGGRRRRQTTGRRSR